MASDVIPMPVERLRPGDVLVLPMGRRVTVERVDEYGDGLFVVRWWREAEYGEPGHVPRAGARGLGGRLDGRYLGSLAPRARGELVVAVTREPR